MEVYFHALPHDGEKGRDRLFEKDGCGHSCFEYAEIAGIEEVLDLVKMEREGRLENRVRP